VSWNTVSGNSEQLFGILQGSDMPATVQAKQAVADLDPMIRKVNDAWTSFLAVDLVKFNKDLKSKGIKPITLP
jgi:hypothetical protein